MGRILGRLAGLLVAVGLGTGCAFHLVSVETTSVVEPCADAGPPAVAPSESEKMTPAEALATVKALPLVEWFTDQVVKGKVVEAAIAAGAPVRYRTTRKVSWFKWER